MTIVHRTRNLYFSISEFDSLLSPERKILCVTSKKEKLITKIIFKRSNMKLCIYAG